MMAIPLRPDTPGPDAMNRRCAWRLGPNLYEVVSRDAGRRYRVSVVAGVPVCSCPAGVHRRACWHAATVLRRLIREGDDQVMDLVSRLLSRRAA
jgi:SWIM zinc finger